MYDTPTATRSSDTLRTQLLNGSGETFAAARVDAFVTCVVIASVPPRSAAAAVDAAVGWPSVLTAIHAPPSGRTTVWIASHTESNHGILSATNSTRYIASARPITIG